MSTTKKFCPKCNNENELYPKEDEEWKIRVYACRTCDHREVAQQYLVSAEPKLHRTRCVICPKCEHWGVEFFMLRTRSGVPVGVSCICRNKDCLHRFWDDDSKAEKD
nr:DNA-directed RNA polymerases II, IV and V subunit 9A [Ipomoea batatas]